MVSQTAERDTQLNLMNTSTRGTSATETQNHEGATKANALPDWLVAFLGQVKRSATLLAKGHEPKVVGVLPARWELLTNVAAKAHGNAWMRLIQESRCDQVRY